MCKLRCCDVYLCTWVFKIWQIFLFANVMLNSIQICIQYLREHKLNVFIATEVHNLRNSSFFWGGGALNFFFQSLDLYKWNE